jgi:hypothetical protein
MSTNSILLKLTATADILGGEVFFADESGNDAQYNNHGLIPNGMYIRLRGSDNSIAYISAQELDAALTTISELTVNTANRALNTVNSLTDNIATKDDIDTLQNLIEAKASDTDIALLQADVATKANKDELDAYINAANEKADIEVVNELIDIINNKADKSVVDALVADITTKADKSVVEYLKNEVNNRVTKTEITLLVNDIKALENTVKQITDKNTIDTLTGKISELERKLSSKLSATDLSSINSNISNIYNQLNVLGNRVDHAETNLNSKASKIFVTEKVSELSTSFNDINTKLNTKASKNDVAVKANKSDLDSVTKKVVTLTNDVATIKSNTSNNTNDIYKKLAGKADKATTEAALDTLRTTISNKADGDIYAKVNSINTLVLDTKTKCDENYVSLATAIDGLECDLENSVKTLKSSDTNLTNRINQQADSITVLQNTTSTHTEQLKQPWVRVLSTKEYSSLRPAKEGMSYSSYYKYPNIVYFVVDFNRPKAIYIGDIQIAKAEQKGSAGFAYTFPISF